MSHFLEGCWGNHDWHGYFEAQNSSCHVYLAHINKNSWPEPACFPLTLFSTSIFVCFAFIEIKVYKK